MCMYVYIYIYIYIVLKVLIKTINRQSFLFLILKIK